MNARTKNRIMFGLKVVVATVLITWMIRSGTLDFGALRVFVDRPLLLGLDLLIFLLATGFGALRWRALLSLAGASVPLGRAMQLQLTALFFNVVIPGNVGGDVVKALYVARESPPSKRTTILLIVFVERLIGLAGLVLVASLVVVVRAPVIMADPQLRQLAAAVLVLGAGVVVGPALFVLFMRRAGDRLEAWTTGTSPVAKIAGQLVAAARLLSSGPKQLVIALGLSMAAHTAAITLFTLLAQTITGAPVPFSSIATVFPLGILTMILPISPAGLGVGHVAFSKLFEMIGIKGGATIFNVYLLGQIAPCLIGVIPYLALKRSGALPTEAEASAATPPSATTPTT